MMRSLFAGVSALRYHQVRMDVIGNNIANVNTIGYKGSRVTFKELLSQTIRDAAAPQGNRGGINPTQVGLGVNLGAITTYHTQGNPQVTGISTDLTIQGDGFFILANGPERFYTRAGMFDIDSAGNLVSLTTGLKVLGWTADETGRIDTNAPLREVVIPKGATIDPLATTEISFEGNLDSRVNGSWTISPSTFEIVSGGHAVELTIEIVPTGNFNEYEVTLRASDGGFLDSGSPPSTSPTWTGTFRLDVDGNVILDPSMPANLQLQFGPSDSQQTVNINLPSGTDREFRWTDDNGSHEYAATYEEPPTSITTIEVFDSLGRTHEVVTHFRRISDTEWEWWAEDTAGNPLSSGGILTFDSRGRLIGQTGEISFAPGGGADPITITPSFAGVTQYGGDTTAEAKFQNGYGAGVLTSFSVDANGVITGSFSNGLDRQLAQVATATFANPAGLIKSGDTLFRVSNNSGPALIGVAGTGTRGGIMAGSLEMSNVDLSQEFTDMIITQRGFQANSRVITASDEMLQELVNLKR